jgi:hypothetical protein
MSAAHARLHAPALPARRSTLVVALLAALSCAVLIAAPACVHAREPAAAAAAPAASPVGPRHDDLAGPR